MMGSVKINYVAVLATVAVLSVIVIWLKFGGMGGGFGSGNRPLDPPEVHQSCFFLGLIL